jgi:hypothetical protein
MTRTRDAGIAALEVHRGHLSLIDGDPDGARALLPRPTEPLHDEVRLAVRLLDAALTRSA